MTLQVARVAEQSDAYMQFPGVSKLIRWLHHIAADTAGCEVQWVTWYELLFSLQLGTGVRSLSWHQGKWSLTDLHKDYQIRKECNAFAMYIQALIHVVHPEWMSSHVKPSFYKYQLWAMCVAMRWNPADQKRTHQWMIDNMGDQPIRQLGRAMSSLPQAVDSTPCLPPCGGLHRYF